MVKYYVNGKWRDGVVISSHESYHSTATGLRSARREWGSKYKNIKAKKRGGLGQDRNDFIVYGQRK